MNLRPRQNASGGGKIRKFHTLSWLITFPCLVFVLIFGTHMYTHRAHDSVCKYSCWDITFQVSKVPMPSREEKYCHKDIPGAKFLYTSGNQSSLVLDGQLILFFFPVLVPVNQLLYFCCFFFYEKNITDHFVLRLGPECCSASLSAVDVKWAAVADQPS